MKLRKLKKLLNNTGYYVTNQYDLYLAIGGPMCHDLIRVDAKTFKMKGALDTFNEGRKHIRESNKEMLFIWDTLVDLIASGEIKDILTGTDEIDPKIPVFSFMHGKIVESFTDKWHYESITAEGYQLDRAEWFQTKIEAINSGVSECNDYIKMHQDNIDSRMKEIEELKKKISGRNSQLSYLREIKETEKL